MGFNYRTAFLIFHDSIIQIIVPLFGLLGKQKIQIIVPFWESVRFGGGVGGTKKTVGKYAQLRYMILI